MIGSSSGLLGAGIELKVNQIKRATHSYLRDRTNQATSTLTSATGPATGHHERQVR